MRDLGADPVLLARLGMDGDGIADSLPETLSAGQQQKIALAMVLGEDADLYILDEPVANLDTASREIAMDAIFARSHGRMLVMIMHGAEAYRARFDHVHELGRSMWQPARVTPVHVRERHDMKSIQGAEKGAGMRRLVYCAQVALHNTLRSKAITALMVLAIAVGIGASMTTLTVVYLLSGDPLPGRSGDLYPQLDANPNSKGREPYDVLDYRSAFDLWSSGARTSRRWWLPIRSSCGPIRAARHRSSAHRSPPPPTSRRCSPLAHGRWWSREEDDARARVVVISSELNEQMFGGGDSVGQTLRVKDTAMRIVGVLAPWRPSPLFYKVRGGRFSGGNTSGFFASADDLFMPLTSSLEINDGDFVPFTCWSTPEARPAADRAVCLGTPMGQAGQRRQGGRLSAVPAELCR